MGISAKDYSVSTLLRVDRPGSVEDRHRADRQTAGELLTADEASEQYGIPRSAVDVWYASGRLTAHYPGGHRRFRADQVERLLPLLDDARAADASEAADHG